MKHHLLIKICAVLLLLAGCRQEYIEVSNLRCELLVNPVGIDYPNPRLSWEITGNQRNVIQTGYHILVASTKKKLDANEGDLWDTGIVNSEASIQISYAGKPLTSRNECFWKVKTITNKGESKWSETGTWSMGLMNEIDWQAKWIGLDKSFEWDAPDAHYTRLSARYLRKEFPLKDKIEKATIYISGLGLYKLHINGKVIGNQELSPTPTDYFETVKYNTFDVTPQMSEGENTIGIILGNGRFFSMRKRDNYYPSGHHWLYNVKHFGFPKLLFQLEVEYTNGKKEFIASDNSWKITADGPIRANNEFDGEEYDARKEMPGWDKPGYDDHNWLQAEYVNAPGGKLQAQINPNIQVMETVTPISINELKPGTFILDMGQNMVGWLQLKAKANRGDSIQLRFSEMLSPDGSLYMDNIREAQVTDKYVFKGEAEETWEPKFVYHGFRYAEITSFPGQLTVNNFIGKVLYDEMETTGHFETSDLTINQIYSNATWGIKGNYRGMPTDCPQRDERMGWLGDRAAGSLGESFIFNVNSLYTKWLDDIQDAQRETGSIPDVAPNYWDAYNDNMTWPGAYVIIAGMLYDQYGDIKPIRDHYDSMKKWMDYMKGKFLVDNIMTRDVYGDWCLPPESPELIHSQDPERRTDGPLIGTAFYYQIANIMSRFASLLGKTADVEYFAAQAEEVKKAFNEKFFNTDAGYYGNNTVTSNLLPLCYGMVPSAYEKSVVEHIISKTENDFNGHVSTGLVGIQWLMRGLTKYGDPELAWRIATNRTYPSWGYMIENNATTIWELWNGNTANPEMNSANHVMLLGDLVTWFYEHLAGIKNQSPYVGFKEIEMNPFIANELTYVKASFHSVHGLIKSHWKKTNGIFSWEITVPANTHATIYIPTSDKETVTENGKQISTIPDIQFIKEENGKAVYHINSGNYKFDSKL